MSINFRDKIAFLFNSGRGIDTDQIDGLVEIPEGTQDNDALRWDEDLEQWTATQPSSDVRGYPYFVLTQNPDGDELKAALDFHLENPPDHRFVQEIQDGQPFSVSGGYQFTHPLTESNQYSRINNAWLAGTPATWWAVVNASNDRADAYWTKYYTQNLNIYDVRIAVTTTLPPAEADFVSVGMLRDGEPYTMPTFAVDSLPVVLGA